MSHNSGQSQVAGQPYSVRCEMPVRTVVLNLGGRRWLPLMVLVGLVFAVASSSVAQDTQSVPRPASPSATEGTLPKSAVVPIGGLSTSAPLPEAASGAGLEGLPFKIKYFLNNGGELVPVRVDVRLETLLQLLENQQAPLESQRPRVSVSSIELTGTADDEAATLDAKFVVQVTQSHQALLFPLGLSEAVIQEFEFRGPNMPIYWVKDPALGYCWWLDGDGSYEFRLKLRVPVRRVTSPWRRLRLTLPAAPISSLQLEIPEAAPVFKAVEDVALESRPLSADRTQVRASGLGNLLDLQWQPTASVGDQQAKLEVNTNLLVRSSGNAFVIEGRQYVKALQGAFREYTVRLPHNSQLLQVEGEEIRERRVDPQDPQRVTIELNNATTGTVRVQWSVRLPQEPGKRPILKGLSVENARQQNGEIGLIAAEGARWAFADATGQNLERMNAGELSSRLGVNNIVRAYRFLGPAFELPLELQAVEAFFDVRPLLVLFATRDELRLEGRYDIRTFRGQLTELAVEWPDWRTEGWKLEPVQAVGSIVTGYATDDASANGRIVIGISDTAPQNFELRLVARCQAPRRDARVSLPRLIGPSTASTRVVFLHAENVESEVAPQGETALRPISGDESLTSESLGYDPGLKVRQYRLETDERVLAVAVTPQLRQVSVESRTFVELTGRRLEVRQLLQHRIDYERLGSLQIQVPLELAPGVRFAYRGRELLPTWTDSDRPRERIAGLLLPEPAIGDVQLEITWAQSLPGGLWADKDSDITIPLLASRAGALAKNVLEFSRPAWFDVAAVDSEWQVEHADEQISRWSADPAVTVFDGLLSPTSGNEGGEFLASRGAVHVSVDRNGLQSYVVQARLAGTGPHLNVQVPSGASPAQFSWDGRLVPDAEVLEFPVGSRRYTVPWPTDEDVAKEHVLMAEYTLPNAAGFGISTLVETQTPKLPQCRWATRVVWNVKVPNDQHLFSPPQNVSPLFHWRRQGAVWFRSPTVTDEELQEWLSAPTPKPTSDLSGVANAYAFSQVGPLDELRLRMISSPAAFLLGASLSLAVGFLMIKVPVLRSVFSVLCLSCIVMAAALWYLPQLELLLQPMLFGAALSVLLGLQEIWNRRRTAGTILTLAATPSDWRPPTADGSETHSLQGRGQDSATIFRESLPEDSRSRQAVESHVG